MNPLYYVTFTTFTLCASFIMFRGFNTSDAVNTISLLCGFLVIFSGVYLLNLSREDPDGRMLTGGEGHGFEDAIPTDTMTAFGTRRSMQARGSISESGGHSRRHSWGSSVGGGRRSMGDREALMDGFALDDLAEDSDEELDQRKKDEELGLPTGRLGNGNLAVHPSARLSGSGRTRTEKEQPKTPK